MILKQSLALVLAGMVVLNGCTSWSTMDHYPEVTDTGETRLLLKNGSVLKVKEVHVESDTLFAKGKRTVATGWRYETGYWDVPVAVSLQDLQGIKQRGISTGKTVLLVTGTVLILGAIAGGVALATWDYGGSWGSN